LLKENANPKGVRTEYCHTTILLLLYTKIKMHSRNHFTAAENETEEELKNQKSQTLIIVKKVERIQGSI
jgi:hypothetical protein